MTATQHGFTLLEGLIVLSILTLLVAIGVPSIVEMRHKNAASAHVLALKSALNMARQLAISEATTIVICTPNGSMTGCQRSTNWSNGVIVFKKEDAADGLNPAEIFLREYGPRQQEGRFTSNSSAGLIEFNPLGLTTNLSSITYCPSGSNLNHLIQKLTIAMTGKVSHKQEGTCGS